MTTQTHQWMMNPEGPTNGMTQEMHLVLQAVGNYLSQEEKLKIAESEKAEARKQALLTDIDNILKKYGDHSLK